MLEVACTNTIIHPWAVIYQKRTTEVSTVRQGGYIFDRRIFLLTIHPANTPITDPAVMRRWRLESLTLTAHG